MINHCPACGANWEVLINSLKECAPTENFEIAARIIKNCPSCTKELGDLLKDCENVIQKDIEYYKNLKGVS